MLQGKICRRAELPTSGSPENNAFDAVGGSGAVLPLSVDDEVSVPDLQMYQKYVGCVGRDLAAATAARRQDAVHEKLKEREVTTR